MNNHPTITVTPCGTASLDHTRAVARSHFNSRRVSLAPPLAPSMSITDRTAFAHIAQRAQTIIPDGEFPHMPIVMMDFADVPTPAAPAVMVH